MHSFLKGYAPVFGSQDMLYAFTIIEVSVWWLDRSKNEQVAEMLKLEIKCTIRI